jgi:hypothetical protein
MQHHMESRALVNQSTAWREFAQNRDGGGIYAFGNKDAKECRGRNVHRSEDVVSLEERVITKSSNFIPTSFSSSSEE